MSVQCMCTSLVMLFMHCIRIHRAKIFIQVYYLYGAKIPCNNKPKKMQSIFFKLVWHPSQVPFSRYRLFLLIIKHAKLCIAFHLFLASAHKHIHVCSLRICETEKNGFFSSTNMSANMLSAQDVCKNGKLRSFYLNWNLSELRLQIPYSKARCLWNTNQWNDSSRREKGCFEKIIRNEQHYEIKRPFDSTPLNDWNFFSINTSNYYV